MTCGEPPATTSGEREGVLSDIVRQLEDLHASVRAVALPSMGSHAARVHTGVAVGGDVTFGIARRIG